MVLLNSKLFSYIYKNKCPQVGKVFAEVKPSIIKSLPLKQIKEETQQVFIAIANKMLLLNQQLQGKRNKFLNRSRDNFEIEKTTKKFETFYNYDFKTFVSELKKQKVNLSLVQQDEWEEYFNDYKNEINILQDEVKTTDKEIDQMVYELYELTEDEIEIIEKI